MELHKINKVGILAIQGSFAEHAQILNKLGQEFIYVRTKDDLDKLTHLILPGGESTTMTKLLKSFDMWDEMQKKIKNKEIQVFGTCAGAILCKYFGMNFEVNRNGYGSQQESFSADLNSEKFHGLRGIFIRAPRFIEIGKDVEILATYDNEPVILEQDNFLVLAFHPEISGETRIHKYFLAKI